MRQTPGALRPRPAPQFTTHFAGCRTSIFCLQNLPFNMSVTETTGRSIDTEKIHEINEKIKVIQKIARNSRIEHIHKSKALKNLLIYFTGADKQIVEQVFNVYLTKMTFIGWVNSKKENQGAPIATYEHLRNTIINEYVNKLNLPLRSTIFTEITALGYFPYTTTMSNSDVLNHGFKWKRLPNLTADKKEGSDRKVIIVEESEQFFRRLKYFYKMKEYRESGRNIVHLEVVDVCRYYKDSDNTVTVVLAASSDDGIINEKVEKDLSEWLKNNLYNVPENSVFVLEPTDLELEELCELPSIHSPKSKMIKWLECYNIPYEATFHRAELFSLIQKYKGRCPPKYEYCEYIKSHGHDVIIRPKELSYTKYFDFLLKDLPFFVSMTENFNNNFGHCLSKVTIEECVKQDVIMAEKEMAIYKDDQKLELIIDKIIETFKDQRLSKCDLEKLACETVIGNNDFYDSILCTYERQ